MLATSPLHNNPPTRKKKSMQISFPRVQMVHGRKCWLPAPSFESSMTWCSSFQRSTEKAHLFEDCLIWKMTISCKCASHHKQRQSAHTRSYILQEKQLWIWLVSLAVCNPLLVASKLHRSWNSLAWNPTSENKQPSFFYFFSPCFFSLERGKWEQPSNSEHMPTIHDDTNTPTHTSLCHQSAHPHTFSCCQQARRFYSRDFFFPHKKMAKSNSRLSISLVVMDHIMWAVRSSGSHQSLKKMPIWRWHHCFKEALMSHSQIFTLFVGL